MGLRLIKENTNFNFVGFRKVAFVLSGLLILLGVVSLAIKGGPKYGIDFAGGIMVQVSFKKDASLEEVKKDLKDLKLPGFLVQRFGMEADHEYLIRISASDVPTEQVRTQITESLQKAVGEDGFTIQRLEMVGPKVGADLRTKALEAMFYAILLITIYISGRFEYRWWAAGFMAGGLALVMYVLGQFLSISYLTIAAMLVSLALCWYLKLNYALGAVVALIHDVLITVGVFSLLNKEFDLTIVAALLTIIGYSLNDTIIVFDRIRENLRSKLNKKLTFGEIINSSVNQTLSRTIMTSFTTLLVVLCLFFFGGGVIHDFAFALLIGIGVGTYSSVFVASPILLALVPKEEIEEAKATAV